MKKTARKQVETEFCTRCGERLIVKRVVWLPFDDNNEYEPDLSVATGVLPFGSGCARAVKRDEW